MSDMPTTVATPSPFPAGAIARAILIAPEDFLVFSSYSGETEETLSAYRALGRLGRIPPAREAANLMDELGSGRQLGDANSGIRNHLHFRGDRRCGDRAGQDG